MIGSDRVCLFALGATAELGAGIAQSLSLPLAAHEEREFEDGEHKARPLDPVQGADVYVIQSLHGGPDQGATALIVDDLISTGGTLLRTARAARQAGACRVIALVAHGLFMSGAEQVIADPAIERAIVTDTIPTAAS